MPAARGLHTAGALRGHAQPVRGVARLVPLQRGTDCVSKGFFLCMLSDILRGPLTPTSTNNSVSIDGF